MHKRNVFITGLGCLWGDASSPEALFSRVMSGETWIQNGVGVLQQAFVEDLPRPVNMGVLSGTQCITRAGWSDLSRVGLVIGTTTGMIENWETQYERTLRREELAPPSVLNLRIHELMNQLQKILGLQGPSLVVSSACSASTQAIGIGKQWIETGRVDRCLVGGVETLCHLTLRGFESFQLLSQDPARPFDVSRAGINLSEGAAMMCLESDATNALARLSGFGLSSDGFHMTAPHPEGRGCAESMLMALADAELSAEDISYIHAHGTGSQANDSAEAAAITQVFGPRKKTCSTKSIHGHGLGATGAVESVLDVMSLVRKKCLPHWGCEQLDPSMKIALTDSHETQSPVHIMKNTLGFGGANASLIFSRVS